MHHDMRRPPPKIGSLPLTPKPAKREEPKFVITDPDEVRKRWEGAKAYLGKNLPPWMATMPDRWPPRYDDHEHQPPPLADHWADDPPPWKGDAMTNQPSEPPLPAINFKKLKAARRKVHALGEVVRNEAFDDWLRRGVVIAERPDEWTQARVLYEGYLRHASRYGNNRGDRRLAAEELATETRWGKMMGSLFPSKKRRRDGWHYPIRLKCGA